MENFNELDNSMAVNTGVTFMHTYEVLHNILNQSARHTVNSGTNIAPKDLALLFAPTVVNGAFACELFLKSFLKNKYKTHNLKDLYNVKELDQNIKKGIKDGVVKIMKDNFNQDYTDDDFDKDMQIHGGIFDEWRYFHEKDKKPKGINTHFLYVLAKVLCAFAITERSNNMSLEEMVNKLIKHFIETNQQETADKIEDMYKDIVSKNSEVNTLYQLRGGKDVVADAQINIADNEIKQKIQSIKDMYKSVFSDEVID